MRSFKDIEGLPKLVFGLNYLESISVHALSDAENHTILHSVISAQYQTHAEGAAGIAKASFTLAEMLFPQCSAIWLAKSCHFSGTKSVKTVRWRMVCAMSCHVMPFLTHKLRTVHEICDSVTHVRALNNFVVTSGVVVNQYLWERYRHGELGDKS